MHLVNQITRFIFHQYLETELICLINWLVLKLAYNQNNSISKKLAHQSQAKMIENVCRMHFLPFSNFCIFFTSFSKSFQLKLFKILDLVCSTPVFFSNDMKYLETHVLDSCFRYYFRYCFKTTSFSTTPQCIEKINERDQ